TSFGIRALVDECCRVQRLRARPALVTNSIDALRSFAKAGLGVSLITAMSCQPDVAAGELASIRLSDPGLAASIDVLVLGERRLPLAV
ncbi:LysR substrate-binding domain-containing protein, partial [Acinetobacter baumannii]